MPVVVVTFAVSMLHAQSPTAPTAAEDPAIIDQAWQKASSKYDSQRAALLKQVDAVIIRDRSVPIGNRSEV